jgi:hypothetical protein
MKKVIWLLVLMLMTSVGWAKDPQEITGIEFTEVRITTGATLYPERQADGSYRYRIRLLGIHDQGVESQLRNEFLSELEAEKIRATRDKLQAPDSPKYYEVPRSDGSVSVGERPTIRLHRTPNGFEMRAVLHFEDRDAWDQTKEVELNELKPVDFKSGEPRGFYLPRKNAKYVRVEGLALSKGVLTVLLPMSKLNIDEAGPGDTVQAQTGEIDFTRLRTRVPNNAGRDVSDLTEADHVTDLRTIGIAGGDNKEETLNSLAKKVSDAKRAEEEAAAVKPGFFARAWKACGPATEWLGLGKQK